MKSLSTKLNESLNEGHTFKASDIDKTVKYLADEVGANPGYLFYGEDDEIEEFNDLWKKKKYKQALDALANDRTLEVSDFSDIERFVNEDVNENSNSEKIIVQKFEKKILFEISNAFKEARIGNTIDTTEKTIEIKEYNAEKANEILKKLGVYDAKANFINGILESAEDNLNEAEESKAELEQRLKELNSKIAQWKGKRQNSIHPFDPQKKVSDYVAMMVGWQKNLEKEIASLNESAETIAESEEYKVQQVYWQKAFDEATNAKDKKHAEEMLATLKRLMNESAETINEAKKDDNTRLIDGLKYGFEQLSDAEYKQLYGIDKEKGKENIKKFSPDIYKLVFESAETITETKLSFKQLLDKYADDPKLIGANATTFGDGDGTMTFNFLSKSDRAKTLKTLKSLGFSDENMTLADKDDFYKFKLTVNESAETITEAKIESDEDFIEYGEKLLKKAHGDNYDQAKADKTLKGILKDAGDDYGKAVGALQAGMSEEKDDDVNESAISSEKFLELYPTKPVGGSDRIAYDNDFDRLSANDKKTVEAEHKK